MGIEMPIDRYWLNDSEAAVLRPMDKSRDCLKGFGIREVARASYVSVTAIINMAKKVGYPGYNELISAYGNKHSSISFPENFSNEEKDEFIRLLSRYREKWIIVLNSGFSQNIANHFSEILNLYGSRATANSHLEFLRENAEKGVLIFIVSDSGNTFRLAELVKLVKNHHTDLAAFVGEGKSKTGQLATLTIGTGTYNPWVVSKYQPDLLFGTASNQFELLLNEALKSIFI